MTECPRVSIIIPCYNYELYVGNAVDSCLNQTYKNIEIILIDNGSTDNSRSIILDYKNHSNVKIVLYDENNPPGGNFSVVGNAIENSTGEFISVLYADDWFFPEKIELQIKLFSISKPSVGVVYCHGYKYMENNNKFYKWDHQKVRGYVFKDYLTNGDVVIPISPLSKKCCYETIGTKNCWTGSEYDFLLMSKYFDFDFVDQYLVSMRIHGKNDAYNLLSVYERVKKYHSNALLDENSKKREGYLINKRVSSDYIAYGFEFIKCLNFSKAKEALVSSIKIYPLLIFRPKVIVAIILVFFPKKITRPIISKLFNN